MKSILTILIFLSLVVSGVAQTRNVVAGTNGAVVSPTNFWSADVTNAFSGLGLGTAATNAASAFQPSSLVLSNLSSSNGGALTNLTASNITGIISISNGGISATTAGGARTNLGLGATWLTNTSSSNFRTAIGLGAANNVQFESVVYGSNEINFANAELFGFWEFDQAPTFVDPANTRTNLSLGATWLTNTNVTNFRTAIGLGATNSVTFSNVTATGSIFIGNSAPYLRSDTAGIVGFYNSVDSEYILSMPSDTDDVIINAQWNNAGVRSNLGLGWSALTNTNTAGFNTSLYGSGTNPVLYSTNGEVVSPTNFWQVAPIVTRFVESQPTTNQTTNITAARNLHIHSLAISTTGVTNTIALPTTNSFNGDIALVVHQGPTSSVTAVRTAGAGTNLITLNRFEEAVEFVYYNNVWQFNHNPSFTEPIYFSGTNGVGHAAESRTNLGLPLAALTNTNNANFQAAVFATNTTPTNAANFNSHAAWMDVTVQTNGSNVSFRIPLYK